MLDWMFAYIFNVYDILLLTVTTLAILLIVPLLLKADRHKSDLLLSAFLFTQGGLSLITVLIYNEIIAPSIAAGVTHFLYLLVVLLQLSQGFLLLWYSQTMTGEKIKRSTSAMFILSGLIVSAILVEVFFHAGYLVMHGMAFCVIGISIYTGALAVSRLQKHDIKIRQTYSNIANVKLNWLWYCALGFVLMWGLYFVCIILNILGMPELAVKVTTFANVPPLLLMSCMVIFSQTAVANKIEPIMDAKNSEQGDKQNTETTDKNGQQINQLNEAFNQTYINQIQDLMERVKIYQDPDLRLDGLADSMNVSPRTVSALLNGYYQKNFYDFVNFYRVSDAEQQLKDPINKNKTIQKIFEDAGFNSKTTFNTLFKKLTEKTPSEYRKQIDMVSN